VRLFPHRVVVTERCLHVGFRAVSYMHDRHRRMSRTTGVKEQFEVSLEEMRGLLSHDGRS
jgi:hypothetical protein